MKIKELLERIEAGKRPDLCPNCMASEVTVNTAIGIIHENECPNAWDDQPLRRTTDVK